MTLRALLFALAFHGAAGMAKGKLPLRRHAVPAQPLSNSLGDKAVQLLKSNLNSTAVDLFERSRRSYERTYPFYGRIPTQISEFALSLDFEIETSARVQMTPDILLERGGIDKDMSQTSSARAGLVQESGEELSETVWPKLSKWFTAGIDGTGMFMKAGLHGKVPATRATGTYRQDLSGQVELESVVMSPNDVIKSNFTKELQLVLEKLHEAKVQNAQRNKWYNFPFEDSKGIKVFGSQDPHQPCNVCHVQFTVGIPLMHGTWLLKMSGEARLRDIVEQTETLCMSRGDGPSLTAAVADGCRSEYRSLVSLAAWALRATRDCSGCAHTKRCMTPWLARTHFGDLAMMLKEKYGEQEIKSLSADVMQVGRFSPDDKLLPEGTVDYLKLPEMAELSGMVFPRNPKLHPSQDQIQRADVKGPRETDMPTDIKGLKKLASRMIKNSDLVNSRLRTRTCRLHSRDNVHATAFTVKHWLDGLQQGKDLMSDHDSPLSQSAFSHMVWKSMGSWRMKPGSDRIYLECRSAIDCLADIGMPVGPSGLIQAVGHKMRKFQHTLKERAERLAASDLRRAERLAASDFRRDIWTADSLHNMSNAALQNKSDAALQNKSDAALQNKSEPVRGIGAPSTLEILPEGEMQSLKNRKPSRPIVRREARLTEP